MAPCKEVHFFDAPDFDETEDIDRQNRRYRKAFPNYGGERFLGEATPIYMYLPRAAKRIWDYNPDMKLIFLLRHPVERAISHYRMACDRGKEWLPLPLALAVEGFRLRRGRHNNAHDSPLRWHSYLDRGFYSRQIRRLQAYFPRAQMLFLRSDELWQRHGDSLARVYEFLGVENKTIIPERQRVFAGQYDRDKTIFFYSILNRCYAAELEALARLLSWDLNDWRRPTHYGMEGK